LLLMGLLALVLYMLLACYAPIVISAVGVESAAATVVST
jgi:hypothetical protein